MKTELMVALLAGAVALISAAATIWSSVRNTEKTLANTRALEDIKAEIEKRKRKEERQAQISRYSEPLARSAYDLQSRFYNILKLNLTELYLINGNEREKNYVIDNTVFLIAQYMCWTELARREIQFIDLGNNVETRGLLHLQDNISSLWGADKYSPILRIFAGEQRAIGEALIQTSGRGSECIGYGTFLRELAPGINPLIDYLRRDVSSLESGIEQAADRLRNLQNALVDLLSLLDRDHIRFPSERRTKI